MVKKVKRSVLPIYAFGAVWLVWGLFLSLGTLWDYLLCGGISAAVFVVGKAVFPDKVYELPGQKQEQGSKAAEKEPEPKEEPVSPEVAALRKERDRAVSEMRRLNDSIQDETISAQIDHLEEVTGKILDHVAAQPEKQPQIRRFLDYYLPTTLKILNAYDRMDSVGVSGENIDSTKRRVAAMLDTIVKAYDKQLDALFSAEAMDISTDITVMEQMLAREGLGGSSGETSEEKQEDIHLEL